MRSLLQLLILLESKCGKLDAKSVVEVQDQLLAAHARWVVLLHGVRHKCYLIVAKSLAKLLNQRLEPLEVSARDCEIERGSVLCLVAFRLEPVLVCFNDPDNVLVWLVHWCGSRKLNDSVAEFQVAGGQNKVFGTSDLGPSNIKSISSECIHVGLS